MNTKSRGGTEQASMGAPGTRVMVPQQQSAQGNKGNNGGSGGGSISSADYPGRLGQPEHQMAAELAELLRLVEGQDREESGSLEKLVEAQGIEIQQLKMENAALKKSSAPHLNNADGAGVHEHKTAGLNGGIHSGENLEEIKARALEAEVLAERLKATKAASSSEREAYEEKLAAVALERDKAKKDLARLRQHLLDKETQESEKLEMDTERLSDLEARVVAAERRAQQLEVALQVACAEAKEAKGRAERVEQQTTGDAERLKRELVEAEAALESKDKELDSLQTALGQYYAESEGQERLHGELSAAREEVKRLTDELEGLRAKVASHVAELEKGRERLAVVDGKLADSQGACVKLQDEVTRLRRALEHSMTRVNRMSADSDYLVDRRIVVKLLVTFFERNHSREVLDLMAKMLCFSEEDKQRVGLAQQIRGGVVRGVLSFPGRFVGGLIGAAVPDTPPAASIDEGQSFADLWIDFLVRESEERERRDQERRDQERRDREKIEADTLHSLPPSHPLSPESRHRLSAESTSSTPLYPKRDSSPRHTYRGLNDISMSSTIPASSGYPRSPPHMAHGHRDMPQDMFAETDGLRPQGYALGGASSVAGTPSLGVKDSDPGYTSGGEFSPIPLHSMTPPTAQLGGTFGSMHVPRP